MTDTVGFIQDLPPDLLSAFRSTLEELQDADLLLHVADLSSQYVEEQIRSVRGILSDMGLDRKRELLVFNKMDLVEAPRVLQMLSHYQAVAISALTGEGLEELSREIALILFQDSEGLRRIQEPECPQQEDPGRSSVSRLVR